MTRIVNHLSIDELAERYRSAEETVAKSHFHAIWLLAKGHQIGEVAGVLAFSGRWLQKLIERYNATGPAALGDRRASNGAKPRLLGAEVLAALRERLKLPPADGGLWNAPKVAAWLAQHHGLASVHPQRGWDALKKLDFSIQRPRPRHARAADEAERAAFKKNSPMWSPKRPLGTPARRSRSGRRTSTGSG
jgi:transposase